MWLVYASVFICLNFVNSHGKLVEYKTADYARNPNPAQSYITRYPWRQKETRNLMQYATSQTLIDPNHPEIVSKLLQDLKDSQKSTTVSVGMHSIMHKWKLERVKEVFLKRLAQLSKISLKEFYASEKHNNTSDTPHVKTIRIRNPTKYKGYHFEEGNKIRQRAIKIKKEGIILSVFKNNKIWEQRNKNVTQVEEIKSTTISNIAKKNPKKNIFEFLGLYTTQTDNSLQQNMNSSTPSVDNFSLPKHLIKAILPKTNFFVSDEVKFNNNQTISNTSKINDIYKTMDRNGYRRKEWIKNKLREINRIRIPAKSQWNGVLYYVLPNKRNKVHILLRPTRKSNKNLRSRRQAKNFRSTESKADLLSSLVKRSVILRKATNYFDDIVNRLAVIPVGQTRSHNTDNFVSELSKFTFKRGNDHEQTHHYTGQMYNKITINDLFDLMYKHELSLAEIHKTLNKIVAFNENMLKPKKPVNRFTKIKDILNLKIDTIKTENNDSKENETNENKKDEGLLASRLFSRRLLGSNRIMDPTIKQVHYQTKLCSILTRLANDDAKSRKERHQCMFEILGSKNNKNRKREISYSLDNPFNNDDELYHSDILDSEMLRLSDQIYEEGSGRAIDRNQGLDIVGFYRYSPPDIEYSTFSFSTTERPRPYQTRHYHIHANWHTTERINNVITTPLPKVTRTYMSLEQKFRNYMDYVDNFEHTTETTPRTAPVFNDMKTAVASEKPTTHTRPNLAGKTFTIRRKIWHKDTPEERRKLTPEQVQKVEVIVYGKVGGTADQPEIRPVQKFTIFNKKQESNITTKNIRSEMLFKDLELPNLIRRYTMSKITKGPEITKATTQKSTEATTTTTHKTTRKRTTKPTIKIIKPKPKVKTTKEPTTSTTKYTVFMDKKATEKSNEKNQVDLDTVFIKDDISEAKNAIKKFSEIKLNDIMDNSIENDSRRSFTPRPARVRMPASPFYNIKQKSPDLRPLKKYIPNDSAKGSGLNMRNYNTNKNQVSDIPNQGSVINMNEIREQQSSNKRKNTSFLHLKHYPYIIESIGKNDGKSSEKKQNGNDLLNGNHLIDLWIQHKNPPQERSIVGGVSPMALWRTVFHKKPKKVQKTRLDFKANSDEFYEYFDEEFESRRKKRENHNRLLCTVIRKSNEEDLMQHIKNTWGQRCDILLFIGSRKAENRLHWEYIFAGLKFVFNGYKDIDWILKVDISTYIVVENLLKMLDGHDPKKPIYFGRPSHMSYDSFVLSRAGLQKLITNGLDMPECQVVREAGIRPCLQTVGVKEINPVDQYNRALFYPFGPFSWDPRAEYKPEEALQIWSDYAVSFNNVDFRDMYTMEYFIYHISPYEIPREYIDKVKKIISEPVENNTMSDETDE